MAVLHIRGDGQKIGEVDQSGDITFYDSPSDLYLYADDTVDYGWDDNYYWENDLDHVYVDY